MWFWFLTHVVSDLCQWKRWWGSTNNPMRFKQKVLKFKDQIAHGKCYSATFGVLLIHNRVIYIHNEITL